MGGMIGLVILLFAILLFFYFDTPRLQTCKISSQSQATQIYAALLRAETKGEKAQGYLLVFKDHGRGCQIRGEAAVDALVVYHEKIAQALPDSLVGFLSGRIELIKSEKEQWRKAKGKLQRRMALGHICGALEILNNREEVYEIRAVKDRLFD